jgi:hypothetical protein
VKGETMDDERRNELEYLVQRLNEEGWALEPTDIEEMSAVIDRRQTSANQAKEFNSKRERLIEEGKLVKTVCIYCEGEGYMDREYRQHQCDCEDGAVYCVPYEYKDEFKNIRAWISEGGT